MATETSNIDDVLTNSSNPKIIPESIVEEAPHENEKPTEYQPYQEEESAGESSSGESDHKPEESKPDEELDDYGNVKKPPKTYTEDEVNEMFRKRFKNQPQNEQMPTQNVQNQAKEQGFEYNPESSESWQTQLERFVESTVSKMHQKEYQRQYQAREMQSQNEFEDKFITGMGRFNDFIEVVEAQPIDVPMTYALRGMNDPAAFIYAASKRHPAELARISNIPDPYAKMVEMGKLEERMRKQSSQTNAPKPLSRTKDDAHMNLKDKKEESIEDMIAKSDAKRRAQLAARRGR
jgi:hypothetical protein